MILVYAVTLAASNHAAAALMHPIAVALADALGSDSKPFAMAVLISTTAGFMSPIGYQTHVMVWAREGTSCKILPSMDSSRIFSTGLEVAFSSLFSFRLMAP
jgi:di/tricarboxylate transporter